MIHKKEVQKIQSLISQQIQPCGGDKKEAHSKEVNSEEKQTQKETPEAAVVPITDIQKYSLSPVGTVKSVFKTKNGIPRQSGVCDASRATLTIDKTVFNNPEHSLEGLQNFSHLWVLFVFHKNNNSCVKAKVRPPRLNGMRVGVFSTRSPYRPNPIGLSLVKLDKIIGNTLYLSGVDLLDGTPVLDIKPYIPEYDHVSSIIQQNITYYTEMQGIVSNNTNTSQDSSGSKSDTTIVTETNFKDSEPTERLATNTLEGTSLDCSSKAEQHGLKAVKLDDVKSPKLLPPESTQILGTSGEISREHSVPLKSVTSKTSENVEIASWVINPPISKLDVRFTPTALEQLQLFVNSDYQHGKESLLAEHRLEYTDSFGEIQDSIIKILHNDPRSIYRRKKCTDRLYYFSVDTAHITCWFDNVQQVVEVVKIGCTTKQDHQSDTRDTPPTGEDIYGQHPF